MNHEAEELVALLKNIELRSQKEVDGLPQQRDLTRYWEGLVFNSLGMRLVTALHEVAEILNDVPNLTRVPGAKDWVRGVANIRGNLMPIVDLQLFLGGRQTLIGRRSRVLIIHQEGLNTGLLVSNVLGMRHFPESGRINGLSESENIGSFLDGGFRMDGEDWPIFSMLKLAGDSGFQVAAK